MKRHCVILAAGVCLAAGTVSWALDAVRTTGQTVPLRGEIKLMTPLQVELKQGVLTRKIPVNQIVSISYDGEPASLKTVRTALASSRHEDALTLLEKIKLDEVERLEIKQDVEFYKALCRAQLALGASGGIIAAGKEMAAFVNTHKGSYHWFKANEVLGDLYLAIGAYDKAERHYAQLGEAPWPDHRMRAGVAVGRAWLAQGRTDKALESFERALAIDAPGDLAQPQRLAATLGKARCLAADGNHREAIKTVETILAKADPEEVELHARAYNTLGDALRKSGRTKEALLAFLHVDLLYFTASEAHAEALFNLAELWDEVQETERAVQARRILEERYRNSRWAKRGGS